MRCGPTPGEHWQRRRLPNDQAFRTHLTVPLATVELALGEPRFVLTAAHEVDPVSDITCAPGGPWEGNSDEADMHACVRPCFEGHLGDTVEDGLFGARGVNHAAPASSAHRSLDASRVRRIPASSRSLGC